MTFEWDAAKSTRNLSLRGFGFEFASLVFAGTYVEFDDTRRDYGERRRYAKALEAIRAQDDPDQGPG